MSLDQDISISCNGYSVGAAEYAWRPSPPPYPPPLPRCGRGGGRMMPLTFLLAPLPRPRCGNGRGDERSRGDSGPASVNDAASTTQTSPLPRCGRGAGGEGGPHLPPYPPSSPTLWARRGERRDGSESILAISQMVAQARYMLDKKSGCLIRL